MSLKNHSKMNLSAKINSQSHHNDELNSNKSPILRYINNSMQQTANVKFI